MSTVLLTWKKYSVLQELKICPNVVILQIITFFKNISGKGGEVAGGIIHCGSHPSTAKANGKNPTDLKGTWAGVWKPNAAT